MSTPVIDYHSRMEQLRQEYVRYLPDSDHKEVHSEEYFHQLEILKEIYSRIPPPRERPLTIPVIFNSTYDENFISDYLAYILHPRRNGIGTAPLERLISTVFKEEVMLDEDQVEIRREYQIDDCRIDFVIHLNDESLLVIENKIYSAESAGQTSRYQKSIRSRFEDRQCYFIFLTPQGSKARSDQFKALSYPQLHSILSSIPFPWINDVHKGVLWQDFLNHLEEYIIMDKKTYQLSDLARLYVENYTMIKNLQEAFIQDWPNIIQYLRALIIERMLSEPGDWQTNFDPRYPWQQVFLKSWSPANKLYVHYEFHFQSGCFEKGKFLFSVDVEGGSKADNQRFRTLFERYMPILQAQYDEKGILYQSKDRKNSIASKWFEFTPDLSKIKDEYINALDEFLFLTDPISRVLEEMMNEE